jgi:hypothetical protein
MTRSAGSSRADAEPSEADRHHRATHRQGCLRGQNVGYSIDSRMKASLAVSALRSAITRREPAGTVVHSDGDSPFRSDAFVRTPKNYGLIGSTGRSAPAATTPRWNPSTPCCRRRCSTGNAGNTRAQLRLAIITWTGNACRRRSPSPAVRRPCLPVLGWAAVAAVPSLSEGGLEAGCSGSECPEMPATVCRRCVSGP